MQRRHGKKAERLTEVFEHREQSDYLVRRRSYVTNPEHRFFIALLLNVDNREQIFSLIKSRFPEVDPLDKVLDWTFELAQTRVVGVNTPNALGIEGFDDFDLTILENLLRGRSDEEINAALTADYGAERVASSDAPGRLTRIRESIIFRPLLNS